jgi:lipid II:glycine glycyltransferase (peptidoglycan interpeptide bridge formation enzyme)
MNTTVLPTDWDSRLQRQRGSILQSRPWAEFQQAVGREVVWDRGESWQWLAVVRASRGMRYLMCSYGPMAQDGRAMTAAMKSLVVAGRELKVDFIRVEPQADLTPAQFKKLGARQIAEVQPTHTRLLTLLQSEEQLRSQLASGHRNLINGTERRGITIRSGFDTDLPEFLKMMQETAQRSGVTFHPDSYFQKLWETLSPKGVAKLYVGEVEGRPVAMAMLYDWGGTRYYAHAAAHQDLNRKYSVAVSLLWRAILDAKAANLKVFDLWGVAPEGDSTHRLASLSKFKASFGGQQVDYLGTWDIPLKSLKYGAYSLYRHLKGRD